MYTLMIDYDFVSTKLQLTKNIREAIFFPTIEEAKQTILKDAKIVKAAYFFHLRQYNDIDSNNFVKLNNLGGMTICVLNEISRFRSITSVAFCPLDNQFIKKSGREESFKKTIEQTNNSLCLIGGMSPYGVATKESFNKIIKWAKRQSPKKQIFLLPSNKQTVNIDNFSLYECGKIQIGEKLRSIEEILKQQEEWDY